MSNVKRLFVEKKPGFDIEAGHMLADLRDHLGMQNVKNLRLINRYDLEGITEEVFKRASLTILSEPNVDNISEEIEIADNFHAFAMEYLPGQYDQRADSAAQCIALLTQDEQPAVRTAKIAAVEGDLTDEDIKAIENYFINPVESRLASMDKPESLNLQADVPADIIRINGFISWSEEEVAQYHASMGFAMSVQDLIFCRDYFRDEEKR